MYYIYICRLVGIPFVQKTSHIFTDECTMTYLLLIMDPINLHGYYEGPFSDTFLYSDCNS